MEETMHNSSEPKGRHAAVRTGSVRSLSCYSVDENVLEVLWDEEIQMEELLHFSFDHIDKLAERRGKTIASSEKWRLWDYVQRMRREQPYWVSKESVPWDEVEAKYSLRSRSLSSGSLPGDLEFSRSGQTTPQPMLHSQRTLRPHSQRKPLPSAAPAAAANRPPDELKCEPDERFTLSEQWDAGSPHRGLVVSATCPKKKQGWQRLLGKVFHPKHKSSAKDDGSGEFHFALVANSSSPCSRHEGGTPSPPKMFEKERRAGFLRRSLRRVGMATRKHN